MPVSNNINNDINIASQHSVLRERIVEHAFVTELLKSLWKRHEFDIEILRSEFDRGGYDLVFTKSNIIRHVQLKVMKKDGRRSHFDVSLELAKKPSGCVLIILVNDVDAESYLWFGAEPNSPLPDLQKFKTAKHTKGNSEGKKAERPNLRRVNRNKFEELKTFDAVLERLFGKFGP